MTEPVVMVHGLWYGAWSQRPLAARLARAGLAPARFDYRTLRGGLDEAAERLGGLCESQPGDAVHLLGHSLGGLLILRLLELGACQRPGRVLLLGTPLTGSSVAQRICAWPGGRRLLGASAEPLRQGACWWPEEREVGLIAGTLPLGLGRLSGRIDGPSDGTVALDETRHPGLAARLELPVTHTGMLYSREVARQAAAFLTTGGFLSR